MATHQMTADDFSLSLNGFDEIAIAKAFGDEVSALGSKRPMTFLRALIFVALRRDGSKDAEAYQAAMGLTLREVTEFFPDQEPEVFPDEPVTEQGKGDAPSS
jgi:hypothetical protein